jgi:NAD(P)H dehydrogenase (quinone)
MLTGKKALLVTTSGADESTAQQGGMVEGINETVVNSVFSFSGFAQYKYKNFFAVPTVSDQDRKEMLAELRQLIQNYL